ncbi:C2H2 finger domain protein [Hyaloscypha sp. PMI_1271]|nr:C2H2 finger domain protein [Hyaloscypha sp. PMI_1271]
MRRRQQPTPSSSSSASDSDGSDIESCFDTRDETDAETEPTDIDTDVDGDDEPDLKWIAGEENAHPPEYYLDQEDNSDKSEDEDEDYSDGSLLLLDMIEDQFDRYCKYVRKDPARIMQALSYRTLKAFFEWMLNQRQGKGGRRLAGIKSASTLGTYWKVFRLVYERATREKIEGKLNRQMHRVLRKLAKKYHLSTKKREKTAMYVEDLAEYLQTNLTTTKKRFTHGRQRIQLALFCQLAGFSGNRPSALLKLRYRDIVVTLLRDPNSGPHRILIEFTCEFTKQFLGTKDAIKFVLPEIIFDPSLILSPHVFLLGLIFADRAFAAPNLRFATQLSGLDIRPGCQQLELLFKPSMLDVPIFRKSVKTGYGYEISPYEPLTYPTLLSLMKVIGLILGLLDPTRPYCLRYNAANEFNKSGDVTDALQNMMLQHASIDTFIKHYLPRRSGDIRAIVSGYEPQKDLMRAASRMTRWIDPGRPHALTVEQSRSVDNDRRLRKLLALRAKWSHRYKGAAMKQPGYQSLGSAIVNLRQRLRATLLKQLRDKWDTEHPVDEVELQLAGLKFCDNPGISMPIIDEMPPIQKRLAETVMTLPGTTVVEEFCRRNAAIEAVAAYCHFQEGGAVAMPRGRPSTQKAGPMMAKETNPQLAAAEAEKQALSNAMLLVFTEKRTTTCFLCLGEQSLPFQKRTFKFASPGDLTKHFKRKHLARIKEGDRLRCKVCQMGLQHKNHLLNHAESIHGTVLRVRDPIA